MITILFFDISFISISIDTWFDSLNSFVLPLSKSFALFNILISFLFSFEVNKPSKNLIKILSAIEYIESNIQNIEAQRKDDPII